MLVLNTSALRVLAVFLFASRVSPRRFLAELLAAPLVGPLLCCVGRPREEVAGLICSGKGGSAGRSSCLAWDGVDRADDVRDGSLELGLLSRCIPECRACVFSPHLGKILLPSTCFRANLRTGRGNSVSLCSISVSANHSAPQTALFFGAKVSGSSIRISDRLD